MSKSKLFFIPLVVFLSLGGSLSAQSPEPGASEIDIILDSAEITFTQAVNFVQAAAESPAPAIAVPSPDRPIKLKELSRLVMKSFNMKGSFLYAVFPGSRYAYRELQYLRLLPEPCDPAMKVSGIQLLQIVEQVLNYLDSGEEVQFEKAPVQIEKPQVQTVAPTEAQEQMMEEIRIELNEQEVTNTTVRVVEEGVTISLSDIQFRGDSAELLSSEQEKIRKMAVLLERFPGQPILVGGHTALAGTASGRSRISLERARSVADFLISLGCRTAAEITVQGFGASRPVADNKTAAGQALNRRVEITLLNRE
jgi:outer membrane protein OmpA-like peptidoglycan-associated protein